MTGCRASDSLLHLHCIRILLYITCFSSTIDELIEKVDHLRGGVILDGLGMDSQSLRKSIKTTLLAEPLKEVFRCIICRATVEPPTMLALCCRQIIGCKRCVQQLQNQRCPHCRAENNSNVELNIFDAVLTVLDTVLE